MRKETQFEQIEASIESLRQQNNVDRLYLLTDTGVDPLIRNFLPSLPRLVVEAGEGSKSIEGLARVWDFLVSRGAMRRSALVNVGGGMVSDLGGFAAATFKRGIKCINVPTTLLAAVDAAIGGKTGINFAGLKNEVGAFSLPLAVLPLTSTFASLPEEEWLSGVGEAIKTGMLDSEELFSLATSEAFIIRRDPAVVDEVVGRCAAFKQKIVEQDFREGNLRKMLNLGHTAGHAIESWRMAHGRPLPHGIAVAHGLLFALQRSEAEAGLHPGITARYREVLERYFPPLDMTAGQLREAWRYMAHDKKNTVAGKPAWVLLKALGSPIV